MSVPISCAASSVLQIFNIVGLRPSREGHEDAAREGHEDGEGHEDAASIMRMQRHQSIAPRKEVGFLQLGFNPRQES